MSDMKDRVMQVILAEADVEKGFIPDHAKNKFSDNSGNLKCPFCQQELEDANIHSSGLYFECPNCYMKQKEKDDNYTATPRIWQELIRTRKALDVALCSLQDIAESNGDFITGASTPLDEHEYADMMLKEIKRQMK